LSVLFLCFVFFTNFAKGVSNIVKLMISFYQKEDTVYAVQSIQKLEKEAVERLTWLFSWAEPTANDEIEGIFIGPRQEMITPWSTNAVEITKNMGLSGITRMEIFTRITSPSPDVEDDKSHALRIFDPMQEKVYENLSLDIFSQDMQPEPVQKITDIRSYAAKEGLALNEEEILYLEQLALKLGRPLTDSEVFGFSQVNSEHCRHKIFNGQFIIDDKPCPDSLFQLIKLTSILNPNRLVSAYKDNVAFIEGPSALQFAPKRQYKSDHFIPRLIETVISLKAETHNFPTTVEPFNGAATGSGGEIRDRMAGGIGSIPMAGTAVYMTSYPRIENRPWSKNIKPRRWLYQSPSEILIKASNGASDFGNKFGQPLICGSVLTFEHEENNKIYGYDKVIMLAGGIGYAHRRQAFKNRPRAGDLVVVLGGDNYRIGMGGGAVSSVNTGELAKAVELNAVQRSNPEMQKRVFNVIRALSEQKKNPIIAIHDHGAGGHLNCLCELLEESGGYIDIEKLPVGDKTLSSKEIIGNESQERMGLIISAQDVERLARIAQREHTPMYIVGKVGRNRQLIFQDKEGTPINLSLNDMFGNSPKTVINDRTVVEKFAPVVIPKEDLEERIKQVLRLESVGCKDWLTNKVDRSVTGKVAMQQCCGCLQLPLNNLGAVAIDFRGEKGIATALGHAPSVALVNPAYGSVAAIAEALTNIVWAPLYGRLSAVSLSANWMWPCKNEGEDARLYQAVKAASDFAVKLGINIPTGKDSLSMTQKYPDGSKVFSPGTLIVTAVAEVDDVTKIVSPVLRPLQDSKVLYVNLSGDDFKLGGSAYAQTLNRLGDDVPTIRHTPYFITAFHAVQDLIDSELLLAGHDVSTGGLITALLEMTFADNRLSLHADLSDIAEPDLEKVLFAENAAFLLQVRNDGRAENILTQKGVQFVSMAEVDTEEHHQQLTLKKAEQSFTFDIDSLRDAWYEPSYNLDILQSGKTKATQRLDNFKNQELSFRFPASYTGVLDGYKISSSQHMHHTVAALIREKGTNGDREMANALYLAGFSVRDIHVSDIMSGEEMLDNVQMVVFPGGFSHSDVLGSAKGWASAFLFNEQARETLRRFFERDDTLSLGICNGCQLMVELGLVYPQDAPAPKMLHNDSRKFESNFINVDIVENHSIMLSSLAGSRLGVWVAHGEGKFSLPHPENHYHIPVKYSYSGYPGNPNGSDYNAAAICSHDGRHLAMMPHLERSLYAWQWAYYPAYSRDAVSPWAEAFVNAYKWIRKIQLEKLKEQTL
jgi:phosphoribosylformylglycinamidine synthase